MKLASLLLGLLSCSAFAAQEPFPQPWQQWTSYPLDEAYVFPPATEIYKDYSGDGLLDAVIFQPGTTWTYEGEIHPIHPFVSIMVNEGSGQAREVFMQRADSLDVVRELDADGSPYPDLYVALQEGSVLFTDDMVEQRVGTNRPATGVTRDIDWDGKLDIQIETVHGIAWLVHGNPGDLWSLWILVLSDPNDGDQDGLTGSEEWELGTNPGNPDSDGDTLPDGFEVARGMDPLTPDPDFYAELKTQAFPSGEPTVEIGLDRTVLVRGAVSEGSTVVVQVSTDLVSWRDAGAFTGGELQFASPLETGYVRLVVRPE